MPSGYAPAKTVYQELRSALAPWTKSHGFRRWAGTQAGWQKAINAEELLGFKFEGYSMVNPDTGSSLAGLVQLESISQPTAHVIRQAHFPAAWSAPSWIDSPGSRGRSTSDDHRFHNISRGMPRRIRSWDIIYASCTRRPRSIERGNWCGSPTTVSRTCVTW
jgi:hypothetical protein